MAGGQGEIQKRIKEKFDVLENQFVSAVEHTKKRLLTYFDTFEKEQLNAMAKASFSLMSQLKLRTSKDKEFEAHLLSRLGSLEKQFPEFQKIMKAQIRLPLRDALKRVEFSMPQIEMLPVSYGLAHKKSFNASTTAALSENQSIHSITSLPSGRLAAAVNQQIKVIEVESEKIIASLRAHTERITSITHMKGYFRVPFIESETLSQRLKKTRKTSTRKSSRSNREIEDEFSSTNQSLSGSISSKSQSALPNSENANNESMNEASSAAAEDKPKWKLELKEIICSTSLDKRCQIVDATDYKLMNTLRMSKQGHAALLLTSREVLIQHADGFSLYGDFTVKLGEFRATNTQVLRLAYCPRFNVIVIHSKNKITLVHKKTLKIIRCYFIPLPDSLFMRVCNTNIILIDSNGILTIDLHSGTPSVPYKNLGLGNAMCSLTDLADNKHVAVITTKNEISIINYMQSLVRSTLSLGGKFGERTITYLQDGSNFAISTVDNKIKFWAFSDQNQQ